MKALLVVLVCVVASRGARDSSDAHYHARLRGYSWHTAQARLRPPGNISADFVIDPEQPRGAFAMGCSSQRVILRSSARSWHDMARSQTLTLGGRQPVTLHKVHLQRATASVYVNETVGVVLKIKFSSETSREACALYALNQYEGFPVLHCWLGSGTVQQMTGRPLTAANVPHDGLLQLADILETLDVLGIRHNDAFKVYGNGAVETELMVDANGRLSLVDFGGSSVTASDARAVGLIDSPGPYCKDPSNWSKTNPSITPRHDNALFEVVSILQAGNGTVDAPVGVAAPPHSPRLPLLGRRDGGDLVVRGLRCFEIHANGSLRAKGNPEQEAHMRALLRWLRYSHNCTSLWADVQGDSGFTALLAAEEGYERVVAWGHDHAALGVLSRVLAVHDFPSVEGVEGGSQAGGHPGGSARFLISHKAVVDVGYASAHQFFWPLLKTACSSRGSAEFEIDLKATLLVEYHSSIGALVAALSPERAWLLVEWLALGDVAVQTYVNVHGCEEAFHERLEAIGYTRVGFEFMLKAYGSLVAQPMLSREHGQHDPTLWRDWGYHSFRARVPEKGNAFSSRGLFVVCVRGCGSKIAGSCAATPGCCARHPGACRTKEA